MRSVFFGGVVFLTGAIVSSLAFAAAIAVSKGGLKPDVGAATSVPLTATGDICMSVNAGGNTGPAAGWPLDYQEDLLPVVAPGQVACTTTLRRGPMAGAYPGYGCLAVPKFPASAIFSTFISGERTATIPGPRGSSTESYALGSWTATKLGPFAFNRNAAQAAIAKVTTSGAGALPGSALGFADDPWFLHPESTTPIHLTLTLSDVDIHVTADGSETGVAQLEASGAIGEGDVPGLHILQDGQAQWDFMRVVGTGQSVSISSMVLFEADLTLAAGQTYWMVNDLHAAANIGSIEIRTAPSTWSQMKRLYRP